MPTGLSMWFSHYSLANIGIFTTRPKLNNSACEFVAEYNRWPIRESVVPDVDTAARALDISTEDAVVFVAALAKIMGIAGEDSECAAA